MLTFHPLKVAELRREASDAVCITFEVPEHLQQAYRFIPGQHLGIRVHLDGQEQRRTYSICSGVGEQHLRIGVRIHDQGGVSRHLARSVQVGDLLDVLTPTGRFFAQPDPAAARTYCAFAAGSGITPILGIIRNVLAQEPHSRCIVFYGNRTIANIMFAEELLALKDRYLERLALYFVLSREPQDVELFNGRLDRDKVMSLGATLFEPSAVDAFYLCGPGTMLENARAALLSLGVDGTRIHAERYASEVSPEVQAVAGDSPSEQGQSPEPGQAVAGDSPSKQGQSPIQVTVVMDGRRRSFAMPSSGTTVLQAAEAEGLDLPYACRAGVCSTCRTKVTRGAVTMTENYALEPWEVEQGYVLCCQALPASAELELTYDEC
jgi:ring-1,2-phenylacetyl-CoA epoxidase subunit PaaE